MKKYLLILLTTIFTLNCHSQITFEKGYYINNSNQKTDCLIKNIDWKNNPINFDFQLSENTEIQTINISSVKEFGIYNISKYVRETVKIDRSSENINNLSYDRNPTFKDEELFLKVLIEGKSNLYEYVDGNLIRYFYNKENSPVEQLIFKSYKTNENNIGQNNRFRQQLLNDLKCPNFKMSKFQNIDYRKSDLIKLFTEYSKCNDIESNNFEQKVERDLFNLTFRPRFNSSSLTIENYITNYWDTDFGNKTGFGFGIEAEYILPFNKNKWSISIEPTYQSFKSEKTTNVSDVSGGKRIAQANYNSVEVPTSLRHYFFLNNNSKVFINVSYIFDLSTKSSIEFRRADGSHLETFEVETRNNMAFGVGYKLYDKFSVEFRYQTSREILGNYLFLNSDYKTSSIIFGYSIF